MTDRISSLTVVLSDDIREDEIYLQMLMDAIKQFRLVIDVKPNVSNPADLIAFCRVRNEMLDAMHKLIVGDKP